MIERRAIVERGVGFVSRLPGKVEAGIGLSCAVIYGAITAYPSEWKDFTHDLPVSGAIADALSEEDIRRATGALVIVFGVLAIDGFKKIISERNASYTRDNNTTA